MSDSPFFFIFFFSSRGASYFYLVHLIYLTGSSGSSRRAPLSCCVSLRVSPLVDQSLAASLCRAVVSVYRMCLPPSPSPSHSRELYTSLPSSPLCQVVLGPLAALGDLPVDVLVRGLDVTRLAVDAADGRRAFVGSVSPRSDFATQKGRSTYFWALIWNLTPRGLDESSTYS